MHFGLRMTVLGIFAAAGLALSVATAWSPPLSDPATRDSAEPALNVALPVPATPTLAKVSSPEPTVLLTAPANASPISIQPEVPVSVIQDISPPPPVPQPPPPDPQAMLDEAMERWTTTYWQPVARQFDLLDQTLKAVQKIEQAQKTAEKTEKGEKPQTAIPAPPEPRKQMATPALPEPVRAGSRTPEIALNASRDLVSINAVGSDIREVLKTLSDATGINILASPSVGGPLTISLTDVEVTEALRAILKSTGFSSRGEGNFLYVGTVEELQKMAVANDQIATRVYRPNYATAAELQKLITSMLTPGVGIVSVSTPAEIGIVSNKDKAGGDTFSGTDALVVRDFESVLYHIDQVFLEIDRMPAQVVIQAMILSVRLDDQDTLGVDFELLRNKNHIRLVSGTPLDSLAQMNFDDGLKIGFLDESLFAFVEALETIGDTTVIASPRVMCLNKQRAEILIGSELGYISTTVTETAATQAVEFLEVGTHLKIRPFISHDGMVRLEVHPELSTGSVRVQQGFTLPDKDVTQVTTNVMCRSGATVVIGGLIREDLVTSAQQIPLLGNLPLVGSLFRHRTEDTERREIIVLLTPRIVDEPEMLAEGELALMQSRDRRNAFYDKMQPFNKRRIGERYGRLALSAWAANDPDMALRYANLAIHYDPLHQDAINLRQEIIGTFPQLEPHERNHMRYGLWPLQHPSWDYSAETNWPWRDVGPVSQQVSTPAVDDSPPGPVRHIVTDEPQNK